LNQTTSALFKWYIKEEVPKIIDRHGHIGQRLKDTDVGKAILTPKYNTAYKKELL
jgi:hypothetical protein